jgi:hypothetical protein
MKPEPKKLTVARPLVGFALKVCEGLGVSHTRSGIKLLSAAVGNLTLAYTDEMPDPGTPHSLDIWTRTPSKKVFSARWGGNALKIVCFHRGEWEQQLAAAFAVRRDLLH